jgi:hypothetical protein
MSNGSTDLPMWEITHLEKKVLHQVFCRTMLREIQWWLNAESGEIRALGCHIHIDNAAVDCLEIHFFGRQMVGSEAQA